MATPTLKATTWLSDKQVTAAVKRNAVNPVLKAAMMVEAEAKSSMKGGGRGRAKGKGSPSAPGTPPHIQSDNLRANIRTAPTPEGTALVGPTRQAWYGKVHEFGGRFHPKRPFMFPALLAALNKMPGLFKGLIGPGDEPRKPI